MVAQRRIAPQLDMSVESITPKLAGAWLKDANKNNRPVHRVTVAHYARQMTAGLWRLNGEAIMFSSDGSLLNGQHRLLAIVASGVTIQSVIMRGVLPSAFDTLDSGKRRTTGDIFALRGEQNYNELAAACSIIWRLENASDKDFIHWTSKYATAQELESLLEENPGLRTSMAKIKGIKLGRLISPSLATACHYLFSRKDPELADAFFEQIISGTELSVEQPSYVLRERLLRNITHKGRLTQAEVMALIIKAWNAARRNESIKLLRWSPTGNHSEAFPVIV